jgi:hypothetical protein
VHVIAAVIAGILYSGLNQRALFIWVFGIFALTQMMYVMHARLVPELDAVLAMPILYSVAVSIYTVLNFALWADFSTPETITRNTALGVAMSAFLATFLSTAISIRWRTGGMTLDQHLSWVAAIALLFMILVLGDVVSQIPMPALVAIMIMVSIGTFSWSSIKNLGSHPRSSSIVMLATVVCVVVTHNLAIGVLVGVLLSGIFFAWKIAQLFRVSSRLSEDGRHRTYMVEGQLFFASAEDFMAAFDFREALEKVTIDVSRAHIWDISSVAALDMAVLKFRRDGAEVDIVGMNTASETIVDRLAVHDKPGALDKLMAH